MICCHPKTLETKFTKEIAEFYTLIHKIRNRIHTLIMQNCCKLFFRRLYPIKFIYPIKKYLFLIERMI